MYITPAYVLRHPLFRLTLFCPTLARHTTTTNANESVVTHGLVLDSVAAIEDDLPACRLYPSLLARILRLVVDRNRLAPHLVLVPAMVHMI